MGSETTSLAWRTLVLEGRGDGRMTNRLYELSREVVRFQRVTEHLEAVLEGLADPGLQMRARIEAGTRQAPGRRTKPRPLDKLEGLGVRRAPTEPVQRQPHSGERQAERPVAQDQRLGRHNRRAYRNREHLRDELPLHAGARLEVWVPGRAARHGSELHRALRGLQAHRVAVRIAERCTTPCATIAIAHAACVASPRPRLGAPAAFRCWWFTLRFAHRQKATVHLWRRRALIRITRTF